MGWSYNKQPNTYWNQTNQEEMDSHAKDLPVGSLKVKRLIVNKIDKALDLIFQSDWELNSCTIVFELFPHL